MLIIYFWTRFPALNNRKDFRHIRLVRSPNALNHHRCLQKRHPRSWGKIEAPREIAKARIAAPVIAPAVDPLKMLHQILLQKVKVEDRHRIRF